MGEFSIFHWLIVLAVVLIFFGGRRIPEVMKGLGEGIRSFKDGMSGGAATATAPAQATTDPAVRDFLAESIGGTDAFIGRQIVKAIERGEVPSNADPGALAQIATAAKIGRAHV